MEKLYSIGKGRGVTTFLLIAGLLCGAALLNGCDINQSDTKDFAVETLAMAIGYELRTGFEWTADVDNYYNAIMEGKMSIGAAQAAESYLRTKTHPLIANRLVRLAGMVGFNMDDAGSIIGVDRVDIHLLQVAAQGFKQGILLGSPAKQYGGEVTAKPYSGMVIIPSGIIGSGE